MLVTHYDWDHSVSHFFTYCLIESGIKVCLFVRFPPFFPPSLPFFLPLQKRVSGFREACYTENTKKLTSFPLLRLLFGDFLMLHLKSILPAVVLCPHQVLCPRCDIGLLGLKRKQRKLKEPLPSGKKRSPRVESLSDLERALTESRETASAVRTGVFLLLSPWGRIISNSSLTYWSYWEGKQKNNFKSTLFYQNDFGRIVICKSFEWKVHRGAEDSGKASQIQKQSFQCPRLGPGMQTQDTQANGYVNCNANLLVYNKKYT